MWSADILYLGYIHEKVHEISEGFESKHDQICCVHCTQGSERLIIDLTGMGVSPRTLGKAIPDRCVPSLNRIQTINNHNRYSHKPGLSWVRCGSTGETGLVCPEDLKCRGLMIPLYMFRDASFRDMVYFLKINSDSKKAISLPMA
jgi:hypothetical protein